MQMRAPIHGKPSKTGERKIGPRASLETINAETRGPKSKVAGKKLLARARQRKSKNPDVTISFGLPRETKGNLGLSFRKECCSALPRA